MGQIFHRQASTMDNLKSITSQKSKNNDQFMSTGLDLYKRGQKLLEEKLTAHPYLPKLSSQPPVFKDNGGNGNLPGIAERRSKSS
jgi:hypothetical protein